MDRGLHCNKNGISTLLSRLNVEECLKCVNNGDSARCAMRIEFDEL